MGLKGSLSLSRFLSISVLSTVLSLSHFVCLSVSPVHSARGNEGRVEPLHLP